MSKLEAILSQEVEAEIQALLQEAEAKAEAVSSIYECKEKTAKIIELLRQGLQSFDNYQLAQLNDLAYRGVQRKGLQKKLDERALKNKERYKELDA